MKTEKTAVLAVTSQQKQQQRLPTKKSITSINLFTLSTLIGTYRSACCLLILRVCKELKKNTISRKI